MILSGNEYPKILDEISSFFGDFDVELLLVDDNEMKKINLDNRGIDKTTDVLSFPLFKLPNLPLGSIVINVNLAEKNSNIFNHSLDDEISLMFLHGLLHLLGYDHEIDNGEMRNKEEEIIKYFKLPNSLILRNS